jgi:hypothetical protein
MQSGDRDAGVPSRCPPVIGQRDLVDLDAGDGEHTREPRRSVISTVYSPLRSRISKAVWQMSHRGRRCIIELIASYTMPLNLTEWPPAPNGIQ